MKNYNDYNIEDFASDDNFIDWCLTPDEASDKFWNTWIKDHPKKKDILLEAKILIKDLRHLESEVSPINQQKIWQKIASDISEPKKINFSDRYLKYISVAAALIILSIFWLRYEHFAWNSFTNNLETTQTIVLPDKSTVVLEPSSSLRYPNTFYKERRTVFLKGGGYFSVVRDTLKPFLVYADQTITKVLGTSFTIKAYEESEYVEVKVSSGKVAVYTEQTDEERQINFEEDEDILVLISNKNIELTPNQKLVFNRKKKDMLKTVVKVPQIIVKNEKVSNFQFDNEPIINVFQVLEEAYGIDLVFDENILKSCTIKAKFQDETLFQKLKIICSALNLEFSEKDAIIFIEGKGCR